MRALTGVGVVLAGCGRLAFDPIDRATTDASLDATSGDADLPACVVDSELFDTFDNARWQISFPTNSVMVAITGGQLQMTLAPSQTEYNGLSSRGTFDFTNRALDVEIVQTTSLSNTETIFELEITSTRKLIITMADGRIDFIDRETVDNTQSRQINTGNDRFWRLRHDAANTIMRFEVSPDRQTWTTEHIAGVPSPTNGRIHFFAGAFAANATPGMAILDNFRLTMGDCP